MRLFMVVLTDHMVDKLMEEHTVEQFIRPMGCGPPIDWTETGAGWTGGPFLGDGMCLTEVIKLIHEHGGWSDQARLVELDGYTTYDTKAPVECDLSGTLQVQIYGKEGIIPRFRRVAIPDGLYQAQLSLYGLHKVDADPRT